MTELYFVRHAQPDYKNENDRQRPLTAEGLRDTQLVVDILRDKAIDLFYSSPYVRSVDTVRGAAEYYGLPIITDERLRERQSGKNGNSGGNEAFRAIVRRRWADFNFHEEGGESIGSVQCRNIEAVRELLARHPGKRLAIGTHGTALSAIINYYIPSFGSEDFFRLLNWTPYIVRLDFEGQDFRGLRELGYIEKFYE